MMKEHAIDPNAVRRRAYERWEQRGCPVGSADGDWLDAEQELLEEQRLRASETLRTEVPLPMRATALPAVPRPRRPRSIVTRTSTAPAAQLLAAWVANGRR